MIYIQLILVITLLFCFTNLTKINTIVKTTRPVKDAKSFCLFIGDHMYANNKHIKTCISESPWKSVSGFDHRDFENGLVSLLRLRTELERYRKFFGYNVAYECHYARENKEKIIKQLIPSSNKGKKKPATLKASSSKSKKKGGLLHRIKAKLKKLKNKLKNKAKKLAHKILTEVSGTHTGFFSSAKKKLAEKAKKLKEAAAKKAQAVKEAAKMAAGKVAAVAKKVAKPVVAVAKAVAKPVVKAAKAIAKPIVKAAKKVASKAKEVAKKAVGVVKAGVKAGVNKVKKVAEKVKNAVKAGIAKAKKVVGKVKNAIKAGFKKAKKVAGKVLGKRQGDFGKALHDKHINSDSHILNYLAHTYPNFQKNILGFVKSGLLKEVLGVLTCAMGKKKANKVYKKTIGGINKTMKDLADKTNGKKEEIALGVDLLCNWPRLEDSLLFVKKGFANSSKQWEYFASTINTFLKILSYSG